MSNPLALRPYDLTGRRILLTGAAGGIGRATARLCAALGAGSDVRMHLRCATDEGYDVVARAERNLCR